MEFVLPCNVTQRIQCTNPYFFDIEYLYSHRSFLFKKLLVDENKKYLHHITLQIIQFIKN